MVNYASSSGIRHLVASLVRNRTSVGEEAYSPHNGTDDLLLASRISANYGYRIWLPRSFPVEEIGLGDVVKKIASAIGLKPCGECEHRAAMLNRWVILSRRRRAQSEGSTAQGRAYWTDNNGCWHFDGSCTGGFWWYHRQCIQAPSSQQPDASLVEQCCHNWFRYPWIKLCPNSLEMGCGVCAV